MKTILRYILMAATAVAVVSCKVDDDQYTEQEPGYFVAYDVYESYVDKIYKVAELADFFQAYQKIRTDRKAALELADSYFPSGYLLESELFYEQAYVSGWGTIYLNEDGSFSVLASRYGTGETYGINSSSDRNFSITAVSGEDPGQRSYLRLYAEVSCNDEEVVIKSMEITTSYCEVKSVVGETLPRAIISTGERAFLGTSGSLEFTLSGGGIEDEFVFNIYEDFVTIVRNNKAVKCERFSTYTSGYNYIIG